MTDERLAEIESREKAALSGPWRWNLNLKSKVISLEAVINHYETVMDFVRWGFGGSTVRFQKRLGDGCGVMVPAVEYANVVEKREHHAEWFQTIRQAEADFIANARQDIPDLLSEVKRLRAALATKETAS